MAISRWLSLLEVLALLHCWQWVPGEATCVTNSLTNNVFVRCTGVSLAELGRNASAFDVDADFTTSLHLVQFSDTVVASNVFQLFRNVRDLTFVMSSIDVLERGAFSGLPNLETLTLQNVQLSRLSASAFEGREYNLSTLTLHVVSVNDLALNSDLESIFSSLDGLVIFSTTVLCDCHITWILPILEDYPNILETDLTCKSPLPAVNYIGLKGANESLLNDNCPDICSTVLNDCTANANCTQSGQDEFNCTCVDGFEGNGFTCNDVDECKELNSSILCPTNAACVNMEGGYICQCIGNRTYNGSECTCNENLIEDLESNECVCPSGSVYSTTQELCVCRNNSIWNDSACECLPGFVETNVTGLCECPSGLLLYFDSDLGRPTCVCAFDGLTYDELLGECSCGGNMTFNNSECVCKVGFVVDVDNGTENCVCPPGMEYSTALDSCTCSANFTEYDAVANRCVCQGNRTDVGGHCECRGNLVDSESDEECVCPAGMVYSGTAEMCVCTGNRTYDGSECVCNESLVEDMESNRCVCPDSSVYNATNELCVCRTNSVWNGSVCECLPGFVETNVTGLCECPPNFLLDFDSDLGRSTCVCVFDGLPYDELLGDCTCGGNRTLSGGECVCREGFVVDMDPSNCVCPPGMEYSSSMDTCTCSTDFTEYDAVANQCVCQGNRTDVGGQCECRGNLVDSESGEECVCPAGLVYSGTAEMCVCTGNRTFDGSECVCTDGMEYNASIESCACPPPYTASESGVCECSEGREGCPTLFTRLLRELDRNLSGAVLSALSEVESGEVQPNQTASLLRLVSTSVSHLLQLPANSNEITTVAQALLNVISHLLNESSVSLWDDSLDIDTAVGDLLVAVNGIGEALIPLANQSSTQVVTFQSGNIVLRVVNIDRVDAGQWVNFSTADLGTDDPISFLVLPQNLGNLTSCPTAIVSGAVAGLNHILPRYNNFSIQSVSGDSNGDRILSGLCPARQTVESDVALNSVIIITSLLAKCSVNTSYLDPPVRISLSHEGSEFAAPHCVADSNEQLGAGLQWKEDGCMVISSTATRTECTCSHLTSFAILMHPSIPANPALSIAVKVGLCVSILFLSATVVILFGFKVKSDLPKVHRQLALSLLLTELVFLIGVDRQAVPSPDGLCTTFAAVLHYLLLVNFTWMLIEGVHILVFLIVVFFSPKVYIIYHFLGWGIPLPIVAVSLGFRFCDYGSTTYCWISDDVAVWAFRAPVIVVLAVNCVILLIAVGIVIKEKKKRNMKLNVVVEALRTAFILFPVLGLCWLLGLFLFGDNATYIVVIEWIFFVVVTAQGVLIFVLHCIINTEVRTAIHKKFCGKKHKMRISHDTSSNPTSTTGTLGTLKATMQRKISGMLHTGKTSVYEMSPRKESTISTSSVNPLQDADVEHAQ